MFFIFFSRFSFLFFFFYSTRPDMCGARARTSGKKKNKKKPYISLRSSDTHVRSTTQHDHYYYHYQLAWARPLCSLFETTHVYAAHTRTPTRRHQRAVTNEYRVILSRRPGGFSRPPFSAVPMAPASRHGIRSGLSGVSRARVPDKSCR